MEDIWCFAIQVANSSIHSFPITANDSHLSVFPNPVRGSEANIRYVSAQESRGTLTLRIYALDGSLITSCRFQQDGELQLSTSGMNPGSYIYVVYRANAMIERKLIVVER
jgi:hypothetical protein